MNTIWMCSFILPSPTSPTLSKGRIHPHGTASVRRGGIAVDETSGGGGRSHPGLETHRVPSAAVRCPNGRVAPKARTNHARTPRDQRAFLGRDVLQVCLTACPHHVPSANNFIEHVWVLVEELTSWTSCSPVFTRCSRGLLVVLGTIWQLAGKQDLLDPGMRQLLSSVVFLHLR